MPQDDIGFDFEGIKPFAQKHAGWIIEKVVSQSGGRGMSDFDMETVSGELEAKVLQMAIDFMMDMIRGDDVVVQAVEALPTQSFTNEDFWSWFQKKQVIDYGDRGIVIRDDIQPRPMSFSTFRVVGSRNPENDRVEITMPILLSSLDLITNIGRGGTLEWLNEDWVPKEILEGLLAQLQEATEDVFKGIEDYADKFRKTFEKKTGRKIGEDLAGNSYAKPNYGMVDFSGRAIYSPKNNGNEEIPHENVVRVEFEPKHRKVSDGKGRVSYKRIDTNTWVHVRQDDGSVKRVAAVLSRFEVKVKPYYLEHNVGMGLWDRFYMAELYRELRRLGYDETKPDFELAEAIKDSGIDWDKVGANAEVVIQHWVARNEDWLRRNYGDEFFEAAEKKENG